MNGKIQLDRDTLVRFESELDALRLDVLNDIGERDPWNGKGRQALGQRTQH